MPGRPSKCTWAGLISPQLEWSQGMKSFLNRAKCFLKSEDGPTATEYAVMLALIIIVALGAITGLGTTVKSIFTNVDTGLPTGL